MHIWTKSSASVEEKGRKDDLSHKTQPAFLDHFADLQDSMVKKEQLTSVYPKIQGTRNPWTAAVNSSLLYCTLN